MSKLAESMALVTAVGGEPGRRVAASPGGGSRANIDHPGRNNEMLAPFELTKPGEVAFPNRL